MRALRGVFDLLQCTRTVRVEIEPRVRRSGSRLALVALLILAVNLPSYAEDKPPPAVVVSQVSKQPLHTQDKLVGRVVAEQSVALKARVEGVLEEVNFVEGGSVKRGDVLFRIERIQYEAQYERAKAELQSAQAAALSDKTDLERKKILLAKNDIPQSTVDVAVATYGQSSAAVAEAEAAVKLAKINLDYTDIVSPLDGRIGLSALDVGNIVKADDAVLATVASVDPMLVSFFMSEQAVLEKRRKGLISGDGSTLSAELTLADGKAYSSQGQVMFVGESVSLETDTVELRASYPNPNGLLMPGQVVLVSLLAPGGDDTLSIPLAAVQLDSTGHFVFTVDDNSKTHRTPIEIGDQSSTRVQVLKGLTEGQRVVVQGLQKIHDGGEVTAVESKEQPQA
ncbi:MAG: efflux RND transporter periplasmic adaptor subunit [Pseudomonadota bacterium]